MTEPTDSTADEPTIRPRSRPRARVAGQRKPPSPRPAAIRPIPSPPVQPARPAPARSATDRSVPPKSGTARPVPPTSAPARSSADRSVKAAGSSFGAGSKSAALTSTARRSRQRRTEQGGINLVLVVLGVLTLLAAASVTVSIVERVTHRPGSTPSCFPRPRMPTRRCTASTTPTLGSGRDTLAVLTGELREQFQADLDAQVVPSYLGVSATTRVDNITVGLQSINEEQTEAVVVAYGTFVVKSTVSGQQGTPEGSECAVTADGAEACVNPATEPSEG